MADMEVLAPGGHQHLVDKIKEQLAMKADASLASAVEKVVENQPTAVLGGTVLSASDAYGASMLSLGVDGKSTQDGTPTPDAPVPIVSVDAPTVTLAGKNLFDFGSAWIASSYGGQWRTISYGSPSNTVTVVDNGVTVDPHNGNYGLYVSLGYFPAGTYTVSATKLSAGAAKLYTYPTEPAYGTHPGLEEIGVVAASSITSGTVTVTIDEATWLLVGNYANSSNPLGLYDIQIEVGSTATNYEPYAGTTVPLYDGTLRSLPDGTKDTLALTYLRPSTREGWAWYSRELVQRIDTVDLGTLTWTKYTLSFQSSRITGMSYGVANSINVMCTAYTGITTQDTAPSIDNAIRAHRGYNTLDVFDSSAISQYTEAQFKTAMSGVIAHYKLSTPITHDLGEVELPVLPAPTATVYSDPATGLAMEYVRDTEIVINALYAEIDRAHAAIAPVEHGTSSANYAVGSYLMLDGTFCKVTSAIATGETIAIGTNVVATTVDAELASLA